MKARLRILLSMVVLLLAACSQCPSGINTTDPSCPGYTPYGYQQQQPYGQQYPGTYPNNGYNQGYPTTYPQGYPQTQPYPYNPYAPRYCQPGYPCR